MLLLIYLQSRQGRVRVAAAALKAWRMWVLGEGRDDFDTVRPILLKVSFFTYPFAFTFSQILNIGQLIKS